MAASGDRDCRHYDRGEHESSPNENEHSPIFRPEKLFPLRQRQPAGALILPVTLRNTRAGHRLAVRTIRADIQRVTPPARETQRIAAAFPTHLGTDAAAVVAAMPIASIETTSSFNILIKGESLMIPERIYNPEPAATESLSDLQRGMLHCVYSRHHDGFVRQKHLRPLLLRHEIWVAPFLLRLVGEYVLPIVQDIQAALATDAEKRETLKEFARQNPRFVDVSRRRATSYWNAYYRCDFPRMTDYPGLIAIAYLRP